MIKPNYPPEDRHLLDYTVYIGADEAEIKPRAYKRNNPDADDIKQQAERLIVMVKNMLHTDQLKEIDAVKTENAKLKQQLKDALYKSEVRQ